MPGDAPSEQSRPVRADDAAAIARLAARAFPPTQAPFVRASGEGFVVEAGDRLAAAVLLRVIALPHGRRVGFVSWAMTDPDHRGRGHARRLTALGLERLAALGCTQVVTEIEGHNAASEAVFRSLGFRQLSLRDQIAAFGPLGAAWLRLRIGYATDPGHFLWLHGAALTRGAPGLPEVAVAGAMLPAVALLLGLREAAMRLAARACGPAVSYRAWDSGIGITLAIALLFGRLFPLPGSVYPRADRWPEGAARALALAALAGTGAVALVVAAALWARGGSAGPLAATLAAPLLFVGKPLLLFDTVMAFPPFQSFAAQRIRELHRGLWVAVAALGLALFLL